MIIKGFWEMDIDNSDFDEEFIDINGICIDLAKREFDYSVNNNLMNSNELSWECHPELESEFNQVKPMRFENLIIEDADYNDAEMENNCRITKGNNKLKGDD